MKRAKFVLMSCYFISVTCSYNMYAKIKMLDKLKKNVENTLSNVEKQTKESFTNLINAQKNDKNVQKKTNHLYQLADAITLSGNSQIKGLNFFKHVLDKKIDAAQDFIDKIEWGMENEIVQAHTKNPETGKTILLYAINKKYPESKLPKSKPAIISFILDINEEQLKTEEHLKQLSEYAQKNTGISKPEDISILEQTIEQLLNIQNNLDNLIEIINQLINNEN